MDRDTLLSEDRGRNQGRGDRIPFVVPYHPALKGIYGALSGLQPMLDASEEHKKVFPSKPLVAFRRAKNLKDTLVRAKLAPVQQGDPMILLGAVIDAAKLVAKSVSLCRKGISLCVTLLVRNIV